jgi:Zn-dependent membrane protease YugP
MITRTIVTACQVSRSATEVHNVPGLKHGWQRVRVVVPEHISETEPPMLLLGLILLVLGLVLNISILYTLGIILLLVGAVLYILGAVGRPVGGRKHYW